MRGSCLIVYLLLSICRFFSTDCTCIFIHSALASVFLKFSVSVTVSVLPREATRSAVLPWHCKLSVRPSFCLTLRHRDGREKCRFSTFKSPYLWNGAREGPSCYWPLIVICIRTFDWYQNQLTLNALWARSKVIYCLNAAKNGEIHLSADSNAM